jgi:hypothetical protein
MNDINTANSNDQKTVGSVAAKKIMVKFTTSIFDFKNPANNTYTIDLDKRTFTKDIAKNLLDVCVQAPEIKNARNNPNHRAILQLSPDAMLGFGIELIRVALKLKEVEETGEESPFFCFELLPMYKGGGAQELGVYVSYDSSGIII